MSVNQIDESQIEKISAFIDRGQLSRTLGVGIKTIENWEKDEGLPHYKITTHTVRFSLREVDEWLKSKRVNADKKVKAYSLAAMPDIGIHGIKEGQKLTIIVDGRHFEITGEK